MNTPLPRSRYVFYVLPLLLLAAVAAAPLIGSAFDILELDYLDGIVSNSYLSLPYVVGVATILLLLAIGVYLSQLKLMAARRRRVWVFLNWLAPGLFMAAAAASYDYGGARQQTLLTWAGAPSLGLGFPLVLLLIEGLAFRLCRRLGSGAGEHDWRAMAIPFLRWALRLHPEDLALRIRLGRLHARNDDYAMAIGHLARVGSLEAIDDDDVLRAMETSFRGAGDLPSANEALRRLAELHPADAAFDRRLLDDAVHLDRPEEAIAVLERGRVKENGNLIKLRAELLMRVGRLDEARSQIARLADLEGLPGAGAQRLYLQLIDRRPDDLDAREQLGTLLLAGDEADRREDGAELIEQVVTTDPARVHLNRLLAAFYGQLGRRAHARRHMTRLVETGDVTGDNYIELARLHHEDQEYERERELLSRMTQALPDDWRGFMRLARVQLDLDDLPAAEAAAARARDLAPEDSAGSLSGLERALEIHRHRREVERLRSHVRAHPDDPRARLQLIVELIFVEDYAAAIHESDALLERDPDQLVPVQRHIESGVESVEKHFMLRDYLGDLYFRQERYEDLLDLYRKLAESSIDPPKTMIEGCHKILRRLPDHLPTRVELAYARREEQDWDGVIEALDPVMRAPDPSLAAIDRALWVEAAFHVGRVEEAARAGLPLAEELAAETGFMLLMVRMLQSLDDHVQAEAVFDLAEAARPEDRRLRTLRGEIKTASIEQRIDRLNRRAREQPLSAPERMQLAALHREHDDLEAAIKHYQLASHDEHYAPLALARMAVVLVERDMYDLAAETLQQVRLDRETDARFPEIKKQFYTVARRLEKVKQFDRAVGFYKAVFRVDAAYHDIVSRLERLSR